MAFDMFSLIPSICHQGSNQPLPLTIVNMLPTPAVLALPLLSCPMPHQNLQSAIPQSKRDHSRVLVPIGHSQVLSYSFAPCPPISPYSILNQEDFLTHKFPFVYFF